MERDGKNDASQVSLLAALSIALRPLATCLLNAGVSYRQLAELCKTAFVLAAIENFGARGRPTNTSRVAAMTGISRKEVRRIREAGLGSASSTGHCAHPPSDVLRAWYTDPEFIDEAGNPRELAYKGPGPTFSSLVRKVGGDIPPGAMRAELRRAQAISETDAGQMRPVKRYFIPATPNARLVEGIRYGMAGLLGTIAYNSDPRAGSRKRLQRVVESRSVSRERLDELQDEIEARLTEFSQEIDDLLTRAEQSAPNSSASTADQMVGAGLYFFVDEDPGREPP